MAYNKPCKLHYRIAQGACWLVSKAVFRNKVLRNELKGKKGPFVVIANHQCAYDFVNLICTNSRPMSFVISRSFYSTLPIQGFLNKMGVIPKQQFQTTVTDMKNMKAVIDNGQPLVIYPAGLMCEDGLSTPIPAATFKFLKWLGVDVYVARSYGSYFVMPKWTKGMRPGRTYIDIYKLFSAEELAEASISTIRDETCRALLFDAYREQESNPQRYRKNADLQGLENVLYVCPHCGREFTMTVREENTLCCTACGYAQRGDEYGFLRNDAGIDPEIRYVSDWSRLIFQTLKDQLRQDPAFSLSAETGIHVIRDDLKKFVPLGTGTLRLSSAGIELNGSLDGEPFALTVPVGSIPTLPFSPGKYLEIQDGNDIYRCVLHDGKLVMKFINMIKIFYELRTEETAEASLTK